MDLFWFFLLFVGGFIGSFYGSSVGSGGLVTFPLVVLTGLPIHVAIATNRFGATFLEFFSALRFKKSLKLNLKAGLVLGGVGAVGSLIGAFFVISVDEFFLKIITASVILVLGLLFFIKGKILTKKESGFKDNIFLAAGMIFFLGIYSGFFGVGNGTFITLALVVSGFSVLGGSALARIIGVFTSLVATIVFAFNGLINYSYAIPLALGCSLGAWVGAGIAIKKGENYVKLLVGVVIILTVIKLIFDNPFEMIFNYLL